MNDVTEKTAPTWETLAESGRLDAAVVSFVRGSTTTPSSSWDVNATPIGGSRVPPRARANAGLVYPRRRLRGVGSISRSCPRVGCRNE
jgi:hypothetical protein